MNPKPGKAIWTADSDLLDRMEFIKLSGYIIEEKVETAKRYHVPRQRREHGLKSSVITIADAALAKIA